MTIYLQQLILAAALTYCVDVSGFTESWRGLLARWLRVEELRPLPPFDCGKCATFWGCILWAVIQGQFSLLTFASAAGYSLLSKSLRELMIFISEAVSALFDLITPNR